MLLASSSKSKRSSNTRLLNKAACLMTRMYVQFFFLIRPLRTVCVALISVSVGTHNIKDRLGSK